MLRQAVVVVASGLLVGAALAAAFDAPTVASADDATRNEGVSVASETPATANDLQAPRAHNSPELAVDPTDERFVALANRLDDPDFGCALQLSGNEGRSWVAAEPVTALPDGVEHCYAPQVAFDADGTLYYLFVGLAGQGNTPQGVWLTTSTDRGQTFAQPWQVLGPSNYQVRLAIDRAMGEQGRLHLVWLDVTGDPTLGGLPPTANPVVAAHSDDGGQSFSEPVEVSGAQEQRAVAPAVTVGAQGEVHVVYYDLGDDVRDYQGLSGPVWTGTWAVKAASSSNGGTGFAEPVTVDGELQPGERVTLVFTMPPPAVAADGDGHVYAGWHDARHGDADVFVAHSADRGQSWGQPVRVNDDEQANGAAQLLPQLATAPNGRVDVAFLDRRADPDNVRQHVTYVASENHGETFSANQQLTTEASDSRTGPRFHLPVAQGHVEWGLGLALHAADDHALAAWPDTRFGVPGTAQQDLYTTTVNLAEQPGTPWRWPAAAAGGVVLAAAVGLTVLRRHRRNPDQDAKAPSSAKFSSLGEA